MSDTQDLLNRLENARTKAESMSREKSRLEGELGTLQKQQKEIEDKCKNDFECAVNELPTILDQLDAEAKAKVEAAEITLGLREGKVEAKVEVKKQEHHDEDAL